MFPEVFLEYDFESDNIQATVNRYISNGLEPPYIDAVDVWKVKPEAPMTELLLGTAHHRSPHDNLVSLLGLYRHFSQDTVYTFPSEFRRFLKSCMVKQPVNPAYYTQKPLKILKELSNKTPEELQAIVDRGVYDVS